MWERSETDPGIEESAGLGTTETDSVTGATTGDGTGIDSEIESMTYAETGSVIIGSEISADTDSRLDLVGTDSGTGSETCSGSGVDVGIGSG